LVVHAGAELLDIDEIQDSGLFLAAYENRGRRLRHDHVVLQWEGPVRFVRARLDLERALPLLPGALAANSGVVAFIQNRRTAEVLQALSLATCP
jgi:hypothetical protein